MSDPDPERLDERLRAVERAVTDGDRPPADLADAAEATDRLDRLDGRVADVEERLADLEAATRALRGYVGNVRSVNEEVEERAETAVAVARRVEARLDDHGTPAEPTDDGTSRGPGGGRRPAGGGRGSADTDTHTDRNPDGWPTPWSGVGEDTDTDASAAPRPERDETGTGDRTRVAGDGTRDPGTETAVGAPPDDRHRESGGDRRAWDDGAWPGADDAQSTDARSDGGAWPPDGMDVDRAQPWAVPDPGDEDWDHEDDRKGLLERVRESL